MSDRRKVRRSGGGLMSWGPEGVGAGLTVKGACGVATRPAPAGLALEQ